MGKGKRARTFKLFSSLLSRFWCEFSLPCSWSGRVSSFLWASGLWSAPELFVKEGGSQHVRFLSGKVTLSSDLRFGRGRVC